MPQPFLSPCGSKSVCSVPLPDLLCGSDQNLSHVDLIDLQQLCREESHLVGRSTTRRPSAPPSFRTEQADAFSFPPRSCEVVGLRREKSLFLLGAPRCFLDCWGILWPRAHSLSHSASNFCGIFSSSSFLAVSASSARTISLIPPMRLE